MVQKGIGLKPSTGEHYFNHNQIRRQRPQNFLLHSNLCSSVLPLHFPFHTDFNAQRFHTTDLIHFFSFSLKQVAEFYEKIQTTAHFLQFKTHSFFFFDGVSFKTSGLESQKGTDGLGSRRIFDGIKLSRLLSRTKYSNAWTEVELHSFAEDSFCYQKSHQ